MLGTSGVVGTFWLGVVGTLGVLGTLSVVGTLGVLGTSGVLGNVENTGVPGVCSPSRTAPVLPYWIEASRSLAALLPARSMQPMAMP